MSNKNRFSRSAKNYRRGKPKFTPSGKSFLIVTEGEKTEPNYFIALREHLHLNATEVEIIHPPGTDPITLVDEAIKLKAIRKREAKTGLKVDYDEVWVVFDLEKIHDERRTLAKQAKGKKGAKAVKFAESDPSFEFWLLLHFEFTTAPFADSDSVRARLKKFWVDYSKGATPDKNILNKLSTATINAQRCRKHHIDSQGNGNPGTSVDILTSKMNDATRAHLRINPPKF